MFFFLLVQLTAAATFAVLTGQVDLAGDLGVDDALVLSAIQAAGIVVGLLLVVGGASSWRGSGLRARGRASLAGFVALLPVGLLVILPTMGYVLVTGDDLIDPDLDVARALAYVLLAVLIGVNEELWFRGLIVDVLGGRARPWLVVVVSSILFGLPHLGTNAATVLNAVGVTLAVGVPFAAVRLRHGSLLPLIAWHALIDIWAFLHTSSVIAEGNPSLHDAAVGLVLPLGLALGYAAWLRRETGAGRAA